MNESNDSNTFEDSQGSYKIVSTQVDWIPCNEPINDKSERPPGIGRLYRASGNMLIIKDCCKIAPKQFVGCTRSAIVAFSVGAAGRMRRYLRECMAEYDQMVTLTYPGFFPSNGKIVKEHLRRFLQEIRREYVRTHNDDGKHSSFWFLEFQGRGAPHFHIFTTWTPNKDWVARTWYRIVDSEDERHLQAGTRVEFLRKGRAATIKYASKYAIKQEQKEVPNEYQNVGRFWGVYGRRGTLSASTWLEDSQSRVSHIQTKQQQLFRVINKFLFDGNAEIIHRDAGVAIIICNDEQRMKYIRMRIMMLSAAIHSFDEMFCDAELDYGEGKCL